jgi:hypothetical protein
MTLWLSVVDNPYLYGSTALLAPFIGSSKRIHYPELLA